MFTVQRYQFVLCFIFLHPLNPVQSYRTSICLRNHEHFSLCGLRCPPTCVNLKLLASGEPLCPSTWECRVGCRCAAGYVRDEYSKNCTLVQNCPPSGLTAPVEDIENATKSQDDANVTAVIVVVPETPPPLFLEEIMDFTEENGSATPISEHGEKKHRTRSYEEPHAESGAAKPASPLSNSDEVAYFPKAISHSANPLLLDCEPKVVSGHLAKSAQPAYRTASDVTDILIPISSEALDLDEVLDLDSPSSVITLEENDRKRRNAGIVGRTTHYRVSEDYPELHQGKRHLVSKDYPHPNMVRVTSGSD